LDGNSFKPESLMGASTGRLPQKSSLGILESIDVNGPSAFLETKSKPISNTLIFEHLLKRALIFQESSLQGLLSDRAIHNFPYINKNARSFKEIADTLMSQLELLSMRKPLLSNQDVQTEKMNFDKKCQTTIDPDKETKQMFEEN
jgi:hypothetical protein